MSSLYDNGPPDVGLPVVEAEAIPVYGLSDPLISAEGGAAYIPKARYSDSTTKTRNRQAGSICACLCCSIFLLLFFLIPRKPYFASDYSSSVVSSSPFIISQSYKVFNPNPIPIEINSVNTQVTTITNSEPYYFVTGTGSFPPSTTSVHIGSNSWKSVELYYNFNNTLNAPGAVLANYHQCCQSSSIFTTTGSIDMSTSVSDYNDVSLGGFITLVECCNR